MKKRTLQSDFLPLTPRDWMGKIHVSSHGSNWARGGTAGRFPGVGARATRSDARATIDIRAERLSRPIRPSEGARTEVRHVRKKCTNLFIACAACLQAAARAAAARTAVGIKRLGHFKSRGHSRVHRTLASRRPPPTWLSPSRPRAAARSRRLFAVRARLPASHRRPARAPRPPSPAIVARALELGCSNRRLARAVGRSQPQPRRRHPARAS